MVFAGALALAFPGGEAEGTPSTQIWIPSTDTQPYGTFRLGVDNYTTVFRKQEDGAHESPTIMGVTAGIVERGPIGAEIGIDLKEPTDYPIYLNGKIQVKEDSFSVYFPAIALGVYDFGTQEDETNFNIIYMLAAKTFPVVGRISLGYYVGNESMLKDINGDTENNGVLVSFDRTLAEIDDRLWAAVDYMGGDNVYGALSFGLAWRFAPNISALVGYDIYNDKDLVGEDTITIQFDIDF